MLVEPELGRLRLQLLLVRARAGDQEAHVAELVDHRAASPRARPGSPSRRRAARRAAPASRPGAANCARKLAHLGLVAGLEVGGVDAVRDHRDALLLDPVDVGRRDRACRRSRRSPARRGWPSSARCRGCGSADACRPSPGGGRTRSRGSSSRAARRSAWRGGRPRPRRASRGRARGRSRSGRPSSTPAASMSVFMCSTQVMNSRQLGGAPRLAHAVQVNALDDLLGRRLLAAARQHVHLDALSRRGSPRACARGARGRPRSAAGTPRRASGPASGVAARPAPQGEAGASSGARSSAGARPRRRARPRAPVVDAVVCGPRPTSRGSLSWRRAARRAPARRRPRGCAPAARDSRRPARASP